MINKTVKQCLKATPHSLVALKSGRICSMWLAFTLHGARQHKYTEMYTNLCAKLIEYVEKQHPGFLHLQLDRPDLQHKIRMYLQMLTIYTRCPGDRLANTGTNIDTKTATVYRVPLGTQRFGSGVGVSNYNWIRPRNLMSEHHYVMLRQTFLEHFRNG